MFKPEEKDPFKSILCELNAIDVESDKGLRSKIIISNLLEIFFDTSVSIGKFTRTSKQVDENQLAAIKKHNDKLQGILTSTDLGNYNLSKTDALNLVDRLGIKMEVTTPRHSPTKGN